MNALMPSSNTLKVGTNMQDSKLSLFLWILMIYLICDNTNGISSLELSRKVGINPTTAKLNSCKIKFAMMLRKQLYQLHDQVVEHDEIYIGTPTKYGKRGLGTDKQIIFMNVGLENNLFTTFIRMETAPIIKNEMILSSLTRFTKHVEIIKTDGKIGIKNGLSNLFENTLETISPILPADKIG